MLDLNAIPAIDTHCHPLPVDQTTISRQLLFNALGVSLRGDSGPDAASMMLVRKALKSMAQLLDCEPTWDAVMAARNAHAESSIRQYHELLFSDANIAALMIDSGFPSQPTIEAPEFAEVIPAAIYEGYRIERFISDAGMPINKGAYATLPEFVDAFRVKLDLEAQKPGMRFFKTVIAYATGLAIPRVDEAAALAAWKEHQGPRDAADKVLRDFMFWETALKAREHAIPFQVHTGHTSNSNIWPNVNPILLTPLLNEPDMQDVQFVLVHGGYPYCTEAGYITSVYSNVSLDLSLMIPWASIGIARRIEAILEAAPTNKVMYGSDGIWAPELYWLSARVARQALGGLLDRLISEDYLVPDEALEVARDILYRNAVRIYGLTDLGVEEM